jgi:ethanolamine ammonia-lyase small subunit
VSSRDEVQADAWEPLRRFTAARVGIGRVGSSLPTRALQEFALAHAEARDAVHAPLDVEAVSAELRRLGWGDVTRVRSRARDRAEYLLRPDRGRALDEESARRIEGVSCGLAVVVADGLSSLAVQRHAAALLRELTLRLVGWESVGLLMAEQARVGLGDEIGERMGARATLMLIGERPGLSSADSLGVYLTWAPRVGRTDADRNCVSNVRPEGLGYEEAARRIAFLLEEARRLEVSGVALKDDSDRAMLA